MINTEYSHKQTITDIIVQIELTTAKNIIPNTFIAYFSNVATILQKNVPECKNENVTKYIKGTHLNSMSVFKSTKEVINIVNLLKSSNLVGYDQISPNLIQNVISKISKPIRTINNLYLNTVKNRNNYTHL